MDIREEKGNIYIDKVIDFNIEQTLECGQCFHFERLDNMEYAVIAYGRLLHIKQEKDTLILYGKTKAEAENIWIPYFDLERDYGKIKSTLLKKDEKLKEAITEKYGVRILNQEFYETLISFIISQNKQIPHIKKIVFALSDTYGEPIGEIGGKTYYSFPTLEKLGEVTEDNYRELKTGFRAPYLKCASDMLNSALKENEIRELSYDAAKEMLMQIKGVGEKVANCVLLFGLSHRNAFPVDVWIKRTMEAVYFDGADTSKEKIMEFARDRFGEYGGYAQQYLFFYGRDGGIGVTSKAKGQVGENK